MGRLSFASTLVIAGTDPGPCNEMRCRRKVRHVDADLGDQRGRRFALDTWNGLRQFELGSVGLKLREGRLVEAPGIDFFGDSRSSSDAEISGGPARIEYTERIVG